MVIEPGSPWENGYVESFNGKMRDELLAGEIFYSLKEAQVLIEMWRQDYNTISPHSSLDYQPPAPAAVLPMVSQNQQIELPQTMVPTYRGRSQIMIRIFGLSGYFQDSPMLKGFIGSKKA